MQRKGLYPPQGMTAFPGWSFRYGAKGKGANPDLLGKSVCALVSRGGYADWCGRMALSSSTGSISVRDTAGIPETFFTVWTNVFQRGRLQEGETLLVHGGSSGIGTTAISWPTVGATVYITAGPMKMWVLPEIGWMERSIIGTRILSRNPSKRKTVLMWFRYGGEIISEKHSTDGNRRPFGADSHSTGLSDRVGPQESFNETVYLGSTLRQTVNQKAEIALS